MKRLHVHFVQTNHPRPGEVGMSWYVVVSCMATKAPEHYPHEDGREALEFVRGVTNEQIYGTTLRLEGRQGNKGYRNFN